MNEHVLGIVRSRHYFLMRVWNITRTRGNYTPLGWEVELVDWCEKLFLVDDVALIIDRARFLYCRVYEDDDDDSKEARDADYACLSECDDLPQLDPF